MLISPPRRSLWERAVHHMNGLSMGSTIAALHTRGLLFDETDGPNQGYRRAARRHLAGLGWTRDGAPTDRGRAFAAHAQAYDRVPALLEVAEALPALLFGALDARLARAFRDFGAAYARRWDLDVDDPVQGEIALHLDGHLIAPLAVAMHGADLLTDEGPEYRSLAEIGGNLGPLAGAFDLLEAERWIAVDGMRLRLLPDGRAAARIARTYFYPVRYIPTLRRADDLLFGDALSVPAYAGGDDARRKHIRFSGQVFSKTVAEPFLELFLPLFEGPLEDQPATIVDIGCGDANMLAHLFEAVRTRTARGRHLDSHPLLLVAAEYSAVAREAAAQTLARTGAPHLVLHADINDPGALNARVPLAEALLITKSVIHTRPYVAPTQPPARTARTRAVFVAPDGSAIPGEDMEQSLVDLFEKWRPHVGRHGWLLVDAHTVDSQTTAGLVGRTLQSTLDVTHNFSHQYLVEMEVFRECAAESGLHARAHREIGRAVFGHDYMSIDHFFSEAD